MESSPRFPKLRFRWSTEPVSRVAASRTTARSDQPDARPAQVHPASPHSSARRVRPSPSSRMPHDSRRSPGHDDDTVTAMAEALEPLDDSIDVGEGVVGWRFAPPSQRRAGRADRVRPRPDDGHFVFGRVAAGRRRVRLRCVERHRSRRDERRTRVVIERRDQICRIEVRERPARSGRLGTELLDSNLLELLGQGSDRPEVSGGRCRFSSSRRRLTGSRSSRVIVRSPRSVPEAQ